MHSLAITGSVTIVSAVPIEAVVAIVELVVSISVLLAIRRAIWQTTLAAAWWWMLLAIVAWSGADIYAAAATAGAACFRLAAIGLSVCPVVAVLGAKRPQHHAWQFVVLSLWVILVLPAAEAFFLRGGQPEVGDARAWLLWIVVLLGPINYVPTRHAWPSVVMAVGQIIALSPYLALIHQHLLPHAEVVGHMVYSLGLVTAWATAQRPRSTNPDDYDGLWLDFRNAFGLFWALRVQERINTVARQNDWQFELTWKGLRPVGSDEPLRQIDSAALQDFRSTLKGLLRRFVSSEWIAERLK